MESLANKHSPYSRRQTSLNCNCLQWSVMFLSTAHWARSQRNGRCGGKAGSVLALHLVYPHQQGIKNQHWQLSYLCHAQFIDELRAETFSGPQYQKDKLRSMRGESHISIECLHIYQLNVCWIWIIWTRKKCTCLD